MLLDVACGFQFGLEQLGARPVGFPDAFRGLQFGLEQVGARPVGFPEGHGLRGLTPRAWVLLVVVLRLVRNSIFCACRARWGCFNLLSIRVRDCSNLWVLTCGLPALRWRPGGCWISPLFY